MPEQQSRSERRLSAILAADVAGYSRLMGADEEGTLGALKAHRRELIDPGIAEHRGRIVKTTGDGMLIEFPSVVDAVQCAVALQHGMAERNRGVPAGRRMEFRAGINLGDIIVEGDDIFGDGVNVAARLQEVAPPGGICISRAARDQVRDKLALEFEDLGEKALKNIARPVRVYRVAGAAAAAAPPPTRRWRGRRFRWLGAAAAVAAIVMAGSLYWPRGMPANPPVGRASQPLPLPDRPSIVVLPFANLSGDPQQEYFSDGVSEDLITALSKFRELFVIARNSSFVYKGKAVNVSEVGRTLGVRYVLEGSVRRERDRVRVTAQLIDAASGTHVWAERYDREVKEIFALQDELTERIATTLVSWMKRAEVARALRKAPHDWRAHDFYLRGADAERRVRTEWRPEVLAEARRHLEKSIEIDPNYAPPYASLARVHINGFLQPWNDEDYQKPATAERALVAARKAVELDPLLPLAYEMLGDALYWNRRIGDAITAFERLSALNPHYASGLHGNVLVSAGRHAEAVEVVKRAIRLDPFPPGNYLVYLGRAYFHLGRHKEAIAALQECVRRTGPNYLGCRVWLAASHAEIGETEKAREQAAVIRRVAPKRTASWLGQFYLREEDARKISEALRKAGLPD